MASTGKVHECLFCPQTFNSAVEKDDHTLEHFAQETCTECNRHLIRIGSNLYIKHTTETCLNDKQQHNIGSRVKTQTPIEIEMNVSLEMESENSIIQIKPELDGIDDPINTESSHIEDEGESSSIHQDGTQLVENQNKLSAEDSEDSFRGSNYDDGHHDPLSAEFNPTASPLQIETDPMMQGQGDNNEIEGKVESDIFGKLVTDLNQHKIGNHNFCTVCEQIFPNDMEFKLHKRQCTVIENTKNTDKNVKNNQLVDKPHECPDCGTKFKRLIYLKHHVCQSKMAVPIDLKVHMIDGRFVCDICNSSYATRALLRKHKIIAHKVLGEHACNRCAKVFPTADELTLHRTGCRLRKTILQTFECDICKKIITDCNGERNRCKIRNHMAVHTKRKKNFKCNQCKFAAYHNSNLKAHVRLVHLKERNFVCTVCGKAFSVHFQLKQHAFSHSGEKFKCTHENCDKSFTTPVYLKNHIQSHEVRTPNDLHKCDLCGSTYKTKAGLQTHHKKSHLNIRNHKCLICNQAFHTKTILKTHTLLHTGEKPLSCPHPGCDRKFRTQGNANEHYRSHSGEAPFLCSVDGCQQRFKYKVDFRRHKLKVHGISSEKRK